MTRWEISLPPFMGEVAAKRSKGGTALVSQHKTRGSPPPSRYARHLPRKRGTDFLRNPSTFIGFSSNENDINSRLSARLTREGRIKKLDTEDSRRLDPGSGPG